METSEILKEWAEVKMQFNALYSLLADTRKQLESWDSQLMESIHKTPLTEQDKAKLIKIIEEV